MSTPKNSNAQTKTLILPIKTRLSLSLLSLLTDNAQLSDGSVNRRYLRLLNPCPPAASFPIHGVSTADFTVNPSRNLWFRLFSPASADSDDPLPVIVFFHGGGFAFLSPSFISYDLFCRRLSRLLCAHVVSVNYRLAPEHRYPSQYDDGFDVLKFLDTIGGKTLPPNADLTKCVLAGDSAGGNLAHHVAVRAGRFSFQSLRLSGIVSINPFFGGEERTESEKRLVDAPIVTLNRSDWCWKAFLPAGSNRDHGAANVTGPNKVDLSGLNYPETLVIVSGFDPLQDWQRRYYEWLKQSGVRATLVEYPNMIHAFNMFPELPESGQLIIQIKDFIDSIIKNINA